MNRSVSPSTRGIQFFSCRRGPSGRSTRQSVSRHGPGPRFVDARQHLLAPSLRCQLAHAGEHQSSSAPGEKPHILEAEDQT